MARSRFSKTELKDIAKAWAAISFAFAVAFYGLSFSLDFVYALGAAAFTVGFGFLFHELAHKFAALKYGCRAEFRAFDSMLILAIAFSFLGFIFAAPGAVMIEGHVTKRENGIISVVGSWANIIMAVIFLLLNIILPSYVWAFGASINAWLAIFNMLPLWILDGKKVWGWNKAIWGGTIAAATVVMFF